MQTSTLPQDLRLEYSAEAIQQSVQRIGREVSAWAQQVAQRNDEDILAVPVLRGGIFFFADLVREVTHSVEIAPARAWAYESDQTQKSEIGLQFDAEMVEGRSVLIVDDICDSGRTLAKLCSAVLEAGAREVKSTALIKRMLSTPTFDPTWVGLTYEGPEWFVGYGMDAHEKWRNLRSIYVMLKTG